MSAKDVETFNLSRQWRLTAGVVLAIIYAATIRASWPDLWVILFTTVSGIVLVSAVLIGNVTKVHADGVEVSYVYHLAWREVRSARRRSFLGLPYLFIERTRGLSWWLPLYLSGPREMLDSLVDWAPDGNPIKHVTGKDKNNAV